MPPEPSLGSQIAASLPFLRRYARALTGSQVSGDAFVRTMLYGFDAIIDDAINRRMSLGHGGLALAAMVDALPAHLPLAVEERSSALRGAFPDLNERARECARTSRAWLEGRG